MSLRLFILLFLVWSLATTQSMGQIIADFTFDDDSNPPHSLLINRVGENATNISSFAQSDGEGIFTLSDPDNPAEHPDFDLEIPESMLNQTQSIYLEFDFRSQEDFGWFIYSGYTLEVELFRFGHLDHPDFPDDQGLNVRYSTEQNPENTIESGYVAPLERGERALIGFMYDYESGTAYILKNKSVVWETPEDQKTPGQSLHWQTENGSFYIGSHMNGDGSSTPSLYRFRTFEDLLCVDMLPPDANNETICEPGLVRFQASGGEDGEYRWYQSDSETLIANETSSQYSLHIDQPGTHTFYVSLASEDCESPLVPVYAIVKQLPEVPEVSFSAPCGPEELNISINNSQSDHEYLWYQEENGQVVYQGSSLSLNLKQDTLLYVRARHEQCISPALAVPMEMKELPQIDAGEDLTILKGESVDLKAEGNFVGVHWQEHESLQFPDSPTPRVRPEATRSYVVTAFNEEGCESSDTVRVFVIDKFPVPNAFTPNNDGHNDAWEIPYIDKYPNCRLKVFNRWGNQVFYSEGYSSPWDGTHDGKPLQPGTYYYILELGNEKDPVKGSVLILH